LVKDLANIEIQIYTLEIKLSNYWVLVSIDIDDRDFYFALERYHYHFVIALVKLEIFYFI